MQAPKTSKECSSGNGGTLRNVAWLLVLHGDCDLMIKLCVSTSQPPNPIAHRNMDRETI